MATFKTVVSKYKKDDGTYRVCIRITHNREHKDIPTPFYITSEQLTRGGKLKDQFVIDKVEERIREYRKEELKIGFLAESIGVREFVKMLDNRSDNTDFIQYSKDKIEGIRQAGRDGTYREYIGAIRTLSRFNNEKPLYFDQITANYMLRFFESIQHLSPNTQLSYMTAIKTMYNSAQKQFNNNTVGKIVVRYGVFDLIKLPKRTKSKDNVLRTVEQMQKLIDCPYKKGFFKELAKDMFVLSFICFGTNFADFLRMEKSQYNNGILTYRRKKTELQMGDAADMEVIVPEVGQIIIDKYSSDPKYLIGFGKFKRSHNFTVHIHDYFQEIGLEKPNLKADRAGGRKGKLSFYANRHTMASISRNILKIEFMTVHEMLNHATPKEFQTTDTYIYKDFEQIWEANKKLYSLFDWSFYLKQKKAD